MAGGSLGGDQPVGWSLIASPSQGHHASHPSPCIQMRPMRPQHLPWIRANSRPRSSHRKMSRICKTILASASRL